jgi:hypothetical protein
MLQKGNDGATQRRTEVPEVPISQFVDDFVYMFRLHCQLLARNHAPSYLAEAGQGQRACLYLAPY